MEVKLDKRYPVPAGIEPAWEVLCDIRAVAACMPGAQVTEQIDETHFKGTVKSKVGPAVMSFGGDIELQGISLADRSLKMLAKGADKAGSSASMQLSAHLEPGDAPGHSVLVGQATIIVSGKLAQFGSRLLVPVSDAMLAQFADNFRAAAIARIPVPAPVAPAAAPAGTPVVAAPPVAPAPPAPKPAAPVKELNALALMWTVFKGWLAGLFGKK
jgi:carbon monoxide dehydrogenase subunit G